MNEPAPQTPYALIGGEESLRMLVNRFYDYMDRSQQARPIREMHPPDLAESRAKLFKFLSGWLGGPNLYWKEYGHPRLRARHLPFAIGRAEAQQWLDCMRKALDETPMDDGLREPMFKALTDIALHMINQPD